MSGQDFVTRLGVQLHEAALREERRGSLGSRLTAVRYAMPRRAAVAAGALAAILIAAVIAIGGLSWGPTETVTMPKVIRTFTLADRLGPMATGFGAVWAVDAGDGQILRVDPKSGKVEARIPAAPEAVVNAGAGAVWVLEPMPEQRSRARLVRMEPTTGRITARVSVPLGVQNPPVDVVVVGGVPWVVMPSGAVRIDPQSGRPVQRVRVREADGVPFPFFTSIGADGLWVLARDQRIVRYDARTGRPVEEIPARLPGAVAVQPTQAGPVLATEAGELALADRSDGELVWRKRIGTSLSGPPGIAGDTLYQHVTVRGGARVVALDLATGETRFSVALPEFGIAGAANVGRQLWIGTPSGKVMVVQR